MGICSAQAPAELIRGLSILSMAGMLVLVLVIIIMLSSSMHYILQEFKTVEDAARENDRMNREMLANISHDLRTPLTSIKGYAHGLLDGTASSTEDSYKYLTIIRNKADDMTHLVDEMSFYAQIYQKEHDYSTKTVNANEYFSKCISQASIDLEMKKISIIYEVGISPATEINIDESKLKRVINNIIGNSSKYIQAEMGTLYISTEENENNIVVHFKDDGIGIDKKDLGHIFERLYRADASRKSETGGSGLGLSIAQKIISDHNGKIWADSKVGEGTTVSFSLPIVKNESKEKER